MGGPVLLRFLLALLVLEGWIVILSGARESFGLIVPVSGTADAILLAWPALHARNRGSLR